MNFHFNLTIEYCNTFRVLFCSASVGESSLLFTHLLLFTRCRIGNQIIYGFLGPKSQTSEWVRAGLLLPCMDTMGTNSIDFCIINIQRGRNQQAVVFIICSTISRSRQPGQLYTDRGHSSAQCIGVYRPTGGPAFILATSRSSLLRRSMT